MEKVTWKLSMGTSGCLIITHGFPDYQIIIRMIIIMIIDKNHHHRFNAWSPRTVAVVADLDAAFLVLSFSAAGPVHVLTFQRVVDVDDIAGVDHNDDNSGVDNNNVVDNDDNGGVNKKMLLTTIMLSAGQEIFNFFTNLNFDPTTWVSFSSLGGIGNGFILHFIKNFIFQIQILHFTK